MMGQRNGAIVKREWCNQRGVNGMTSKERMV